MNTHRKVSRPSAWLYALLSLVAVLQLSAQDTSATPDKKKDATDATDTTAKPAAKSTSSDGTVRMNAFTVTEDAIKGYLASDTASGSKVAMKIIDMPQTLNVITRDAMNDSGLSDPNAIFERFAPGVTNLTGPGIEGTNAIIRGFRAQNWSVNGATTHYLSQLVSDNFETVEVIKGPSVMLYGRSAGYGGYINITMKTPSRDPVNAIQFGVGTANFYHSMVDYGQALGASKDFQYRVVLSAEDSDYPSKNYDFNKVFMAAPSFAYDFSPTTRLVVRFEHTQDQQSWTPSQLDKNGNLIRAFSSNEAQSDNKNIDTNNITQAIFTSQLNEQVSLRLNTMYQAMNNDWKYTYGLGDVAPLGQPKQYYTFLPNRRFYKQTDWYGDATLDWKVDDLGHGLSNDLFFNVSFDDFFETISFLANNMLSSTNPRPNPLIDPSNPDLTAMQFEFTYPTLVFPYVTQNSSAVAFGETFSLFDKKLQLIYRGRLNHDQNASLSQSVTPANTPPPVGVLTGTPAAQVTTNVPTWDYGAVYKITPGWAVYYGHTEAYSPVATGFTVAGTRLSPESGQDDEYGTKIDLPAFGGIITGSIAYFSMEVSNKWRPDPFNPGYFIQDGPQQNKGIDAQIGYSGPKFSILGSYYNADGPYQKNQPATGIFPAGNLPGVFAPKVTYSFTLKYNLTDNLSIGGGYHYQGSQVASTRLLISPGFGTTDLFATYTMKLRKGQLRFNLSCTNLSDGTGFTREDSPASVYVQEGRRTKLTTTYSW